MACNEPWRKQTQQDFSAIYLGYGSDTQYFITHLQRYVDSEYHYVPAKKVIEDFLEFETEKLDEIEGNLHENN